MSICTDYNNSDGLDTSELIRVFGKLIGTPSEQVEMNNSEHLVTHEYNSNENALLQTKLLKQEFEIENLKQRIEFLEILLEEKDSMILEKEKRLLLLEYTNNNQEKPINWLSRLFNK